MDPERLTGLLEKYLENELTDAEWRELEECLASAPEACRHFWAYLHQHALLRKFVAEGQGRTLAQVRRRLAAAAAAAALTVAITAGLVVRLSMRDPPEEPPVVEAEVVSRPVDERPVQSPETPIPAEASRDKPEPEREPEPPAAPPASSEVAVDRPPDVTSMPPPVNPPRPRVLLPPEPPPAPRTEPLKATVPAFGRLEQVVGNVFLDGQTCAKAGLEILSGQTLEVPPRECLAAVRCADGTRLEFGPGTRVREMRDEGGKRVALEQGVLVGDVTRQPPGRPLAVQTPNAEFRVLGTRFGLWAQPESSRLEVREGRVRAARRQDGAATEVAAEQVAVVAKGKPVVARPARASADLVALYRFQGGPLDMVQDVSAFGMPCDLEIKHPAHASWTPTGLALRSWTQVSGAPQAAAKIVEACKKSREITLEAWLVPARAHADVAGCPVMMGEYPARNFALAQGRGSWSVTLRTSAADVSPRAELTARGLDAKSVHVVYTRSAAGLERLYLNGVPRATGSRPGDFSAWNDQYRLLLGVEWLGELRLVAIYSRALTAPEVARNLRIGVD